MYVCDGENGRLGSWDEMCRVGEGREGKTGFIV